ncbi:L-glyceraldehyde 3-phosphate reductase [Nesterenkonia natronophila]|uniref:L-glyceraldehyde 3-phosphate reductase n=1 Tax=Nesterenkonia natronophila TaxID=2174932 RepID=A0A3A4FJV9_9MICC|nr:L-glyceraldehyde 3-phosphate reductase [Nesterenkonia natronophila]RJN32685.1 L-glyceraldehyde 3-phosphate reductase [Nesterenkonia natronophila]
MRQSVDVSRWGRETHTPYAAAHDRYSQFNYRRVGRSGLLLPPISLGLWWNFGDATPFADQRKIIRHAFDSGITHFDLANNYGPPYGAAEENFGRVLAKDLRPYRDELIISSKSGWDMWPGPYGNYGSRKYTLASLDEALGRMGLDYVDIFYSHRVDPDTPLEETIGALDTAVRSGKALYVGLSSYSAERTREASRIASELGTPLVIHQPAYSLLNRWVEDGLLDALKETGMGSIAFTPLAQGLLTDKYLKNPEAKPSGGRSSLLSHHLSEDNLDRLRQLNDLAAARGQTLAQLAISWLLRDGGATSVLLGASSTSQLDENLAAVQNTVFAQEELDSIDEITQGDTGINIWSVSSDL